MKSKVGTARVNKIAIGRQYKNVLAKISEKSNTNGKKKYKNEQLRFFKKFFDIDIYLTFYYCTYKST